jgi:tripartite ATP-independent transporter DctM subunit
MFFAGMSGSAIADAGGLGLVEIQAMRDNNYDDEFTIGVTASSSTIGPIIPPSIPFVVYGAVANVSIGGLFIGGFLPGLLIGLTLSVMVYFTARKKNYPILKRSSIKEIFYSFKESVLALLMPLIIIGGIWMGFFTPTEAAFVSILYAIIITKFVYKEFEFKRLPGLLLETVKMVAPAICIVAGANIFGWVMNYEKIDQILLELIFSITTNKYVILLIINIILLILGMFLEVVSVIMLVLPVMQPIVAYLGIHPIHFGVIMVLNLMIGLLTPPVGFVLYILSSAADVSFNFVVKSVLPWLVPLFIAQLLITYIPEIVMFLPRILGFA